jgi:signal peptidase II
VRTLRERRRVIDRRIMLAASVAAIVLALDQVTKAIVERAMAVGESIPLLPFFSLTYVRNTGAAFGILGGLPPVLRVPLFVVVTVLAVGALVSYLRQVEPDASWVVVALGGILGGAAGNLVCRLRYGEVVDFLHLHYRAFDWPMFNVADSAITVGVAIVLLHSFRARPEHQPIKCTDAKQHRSENQGVDQPKLVVDHAATETASDRNSSQADRCPRASNRQETTAECPSP